MRAAPSTVPAPPACVASARAGSSALRMVRPKKTGRAAAGGRSPASISLRRRSRQSCRRLTAGFRRFAQPSASTRAGEQASDPGAEQGGRIRHRPHHGGIRRPASVSCAAVIPAAIEPPAAGRLGRATPALQTARSAVARCTGNDGLRAVRRYGGGPRRSRRASSMRRTSTGVPTATRIVADPGAWRSGRRSGCGPCCRRR